MLLGGYRRVFHGKCVETALRHLTVAFFAPRGMPDFFFPTKSNHQSIPPFLLMKKKIVKETQ